METKAGLEARIRAQRKWIEEHGGNLEECQVRYGDPGRSKCYGEGGTRIYEADTTALRKLESEYETRFGAKMPDAKLTRYHFSFGNSSDGPIGFCAAVWAESPEKAVTMLRARIEDQEHSIDEDDDVPTDGEVEGIEYVTVYFGGAKAITAAWIDETKEAQ